MSEPRPPRLLALLGLVAAALGLAASRGLVDGDLALVPMGWLVFGGAALPLVLLWAPREPSPLKVLYFASLLSPPLVGGLFLAGRSVLGPQAAVEASLAFVGLLQFVGFFRVWHRAAIGRSAALAILLALGLGAGLCVLLQQATRGALLGPLEAQWQGALAQAFLREGPLESPFLAGTALRGVGAYEVTLAALAALLRVPVALAATCWLAVGLASLPVGLYLWGAPLWREARRCALVPWMALFGTGLYLPGLDGLWPGDPLLLAPWSSFLGAGPAGPCLAYLVGGTVAAVHAARHARRPWVGLAAVTLGFAALLEPGLGGPYLATLLIGSLVVPGGPGVRGPVLVAWTGAALPVLAFLRVANLEVLPPSFQAAVELDPRVLVPTQAVALVVSLALLGGRWVGAGGTGDEAGRRTILVLTVLAALVPGVLAFAGSEAVAVPSFQLSGLALGVLAAGGLGDLFDRKRALGVLATPVLLAGGGGALLGGIGYGLELAGATAEEPHALASYPEAEEPDFEEQRRILGPPPPASVYDPRGPLRRMVDWREDGRDLARVLRWLRGEAPRADRPLLLVTPPEDESQLVRQAIGLAVAANLPLWVVPPAELAGSSTRFAPRIEAVRGLYGLGQEPRPDAWRELFLLGRGGYVIVEGEDRQRTTRQVGATTNAGIVTRLLRMGARSVLVHGRVEVFYLDPSLPR